MMKYKWDKKYLYYGVTTFCTVAACVIFYFFVANFFIFTNNVKDFLSNMQGLIYGAAFAYLLRPLMNFFSKKCFYPFLKRFRSGENLDPDSLELRKQSNKKISKIISLFVTMVSTILIFAAMILAIVPELYTAILRIVNKTDTYVDTTVKWAKTTFKDYPSVIKVIEDITENFYDYSGDILQTYVLPKLGNITGLVTGSIGIAMNVAISLIIGFVFCIYILYDKDRLCAQAKKLIFGLFKVSHANDILSWTRRVDKIFRVFVLGKITDAIVVGIVVSITMQILRLPYPILIGVFVGACNIIPYFGPLIGAVPATLLILAEDPKQAIIFVIVILIIQQIDGNIIEPRIIGNFTGVRSMWVIVAVLVGSHLFGFVGCIIGLPLFAIFYIVIKTFISKRLSKKELPKDTNFYFDVGYINVYSSNNSENQEKYKVISTSELEKEEKLVKSTQKKRIKAKKIKNNKIKPKQENNKDNDNK